MIVLDLEGVELQYEFAVSRQAFVLGPPMGAFESQQALVPAAAGFDIGDGDERLWSHVR
jgi:NAD dependent epimerase/dehydratase family enzyme